MPKSLARPHFALFHRTVRTTPAFSLFCNMERVFYLTIILCLLEVSFIYIFIPLTHTVHPSLKNSIYCKLYNKIHGKQIRKSTKINCMSLGGKFYIFTRFNTHCAPVITKTRFIADKLVKCMENKYANAQS